MRALGIVTIQPRGDDPKGVVAIGEAMQPEALFLQRLEEAFDHPVLLRAVRGNVLLVEAVTPRDRDEHLRPEHEAVVEDARMAMGWGLC